MKTVLYANYRDCFVNRRLLNGVRRYASMRGWNLQTIRPSDSAAIRKLMGFWRPDGILYGASGDNEASEFRSFPKTPLVLLDAHIGDERRALRSRVCCDNELIVQTAARELFAPGVDDFAFCGIRNHFAWTGMRARAFESLVEMHGGRFHKVWIPRNGPYDKKFLALLRNLPKPCGLLCVNDEVGAMLLGACAVAKVAVPKEIAVVSVDDDLLICENTKPTLTSVRLDHEAAGFKGAELLDRIMSGRSRRPETILYGPMITIHRASTRLAVRADAAVAAAVEHIRSSVEKPIGVEDVAKKMGCSKRLAQLRFSRSLGKSIGEVIGEIRLERVLYHLRQPDLSIGEIAGICGYRDESALRRFFHSEMGMSMREWRRRNCR